MSLIEALSATVVILLGDNHMPPSPRAELLHVVSQNVPIFGSYIRYVLVEISQVHVGETNGRYSFD
jgi:hypothetical protein